MKNQVTIQNEETKLQSLSDSNINFPIKVDKSLLKLGNYLTQHEKNEIMQYETIYYINLDAKAVERKLNKQDEFQFDDDNNDYKLIVDEHIAYRYQIIDR